MQPPPIPSTATSGLASQVIDSAPYRILFSALLIAAIGDYLFWPAPPGLSVCIFALIVCAILLANRPEAVLNRFVNTMLLLFTATAIQSCIELSFSNVLVLCLLLVVIVGETSFQYLTFGWARWSEALAAFITAPARWVWLQQAMKQSPFDSQRFGKSFSSLIQIALPALILGVGFAILLGKGNAIFGNLTSRLFSSLMELFPSFEFSVGRLFLWIILATFGLALLRPAIAFTTERIWTRTIPMIPLPANASVAKWRSISILVLLNALFFCVNTIDALYLWFHSQLPAGVSYSEFLHRGVNSLIAAVLLSAFVIVAIFQQAGPRPKLLNALGLAWIAQNIVLIGSVLLRLKRYVDAYQLTEQRIYVCFFLLLVTVGFVFLAVHVKRAKGLNWLLFGNAIAAFALFFIVQFLDVQKWVADYNVERWLHDPQRTIDVSYLQTMGSSAWPALIKVAETTNRSEAHDAFQILQQQKKSVLSRVKNWRSWQSREVRKAGLLVQHEIRTRR